MGIMDLLKGKGEENGYMLPVKFRIGDKVWLMDKWKCEPVERVVEGINVQIVSDEAKIVYSFMKDKCLPHNGYNDYLQLDPIEKKDRYFWVHESKVFGSKEELLESL